MSTLSELMAKTLKSHSLAELHKTDLDLPEPLDPKKIVVPRVKLVKHYGKSIAQMFRECENEQEVFELANHITAGLKQGKLKASPSTLRKAAKIAARMVNHFRQRRIEPVSKRLVDQFGKPIF